MSEAHRHWAHYLPDFVGRKTPYWARESVAEHSYPEHWAMMWGWSLDEIERAKAAQQAARQPAPQQNENVCRENAAVQK